ncbi:hypothetical protein BJ085DRAFT_31519 [Dimargaris cristalligena]|uniref:Uncharacterized protein n=1 Tax=Dimargaris cristalligena TaxID=215637 RepID=A0A4P9ZQ23_9FUNG|nr:hypothetical protein BJ085DRAFT_31519 [Dimargaris cristalligena]|eukprot:RKP34460.1 hypothetical protein BJ085DRAFT_31519 [Dimargaris cristalligena]
MVTYQITLLGAASLFVFALTATAYPGELTRRWGEGQQMSMQENLNATPNPHQAQVNGYQDTSTIEKHTKSTGNFQDVLRNLGSNGNPAVWEEFKRRLNTLAGLETWDVILDKASDNVRKFVSRPVSQSRQLISTIKGSSVSTFSRSLFRSKKAPSPTSSQHSSVSATTRPDLDKRVFLNLAKLQGNLMGAAFPLATHATGATLWEIMRVLVVTQKIHTSDMEIPDMFGNLQMSIPVSSQDRASHFITIGYHIVTIGLWRMYRNRQFEDITNFFTKAMLALDSLPAYSFIQNSLFGYMESHATLIITLAAFEKNTTIITEVEGYVAKYLPRKRVFDDLNDYYCKVVTSLDLAQLEVPRDNLLKHWKKSTTCYPSTMGAFMIDNINQWLDKSGDLHVAAPFALAEPLGIVEKAATSEGVLKIWAPKPYQLSSKN